MVARPDETPIGEVILNDTADEGQFTLFANGDPIATVHLASHSGDAVIRTTVGLEIARVGQPSTSISPTNGNTYVVEIPEHLPEPLASMVLAIALTPDTTLGH
ncbi:hypothetical protein D5S19_03660 [Amycolatopsis panacis]|uniref:Uncharacterized protein n=1 Tax=Amycolatopsis panacis TaxID=2340917 RepID=A0A419IAB1_9PSEU|nr:hypothetical protein D5S19_03660 [Amycolatopsis panacis]